MLYNSFVTALPVLYRLFTFFYYIAADAVL